MEIISGIELIDLCLYFRKEKLLVLGDVHFGYEENLNKRGVMIPRHQFVEVMKKIENIIKNLEIDFVVFNGDIKHEFGTISETEWRHSIRLLDLLLKHSKKVIFIKGNHDKILGPIAKKRNVEVAKYYTAGESYICHGHKIPDDKDYLSAKNVIVGHEHPAVTLNKDGRSETFKCFLKGKFEGNNLVVMPSFNLVTEGTNVLKDKLLSPFLNKLGKKILGFDAYLVSDGTVYPFGKLKNLKAL